jgi:hypothetical protein
MTPIAVGHGRVGHSGPGEDRHRGARPACAMIATMEGLDSYWRTRTIAEAQEEGYSHLRATKMRPDR